MSCSYHISLQAGSSTKKPHTHTHAHTPHPHTTHTTHMHTHTHTLLTHNMNMHTHSYLQSLQRSRRCLKWVTLPSLRGGPPTLVEAGRRTWEGGARQAYRADTSASLPRWGGTPWCCWRLWGLLASSQLFVVYSTRWGGAWERGYVRGPAWGSDL